MTMGSRIAQYRRTLNITQEGLAQRLDVTNQAVSKWELDQCCPDIQLLPKLADIFGVTIDALFGRTAAAEERNSLPWEDDNTLRVVLYVGHTLVGSGEAKEDVYFEYEGPALNIESVLSVRCGAVAGSVKAGGNVSCDAVAGNVRAEGNVTCDEVEGDVHAGGNVTCDCIDGNVQAGGNVTCDEVAGDITAGGNVYCDEHEGCVKSGGGQGEAKPHTHRMKFEFGR